MLLYWDHIDDETVKTAKLLAADAAKQAGSDHPDTAISLAPVAYLLYNKVMNVDPADPRQIGRDRFTLSAGHSLLTQYVQLYLSDFDLELDDIKVLRAASSPTPSYPEYGHTKGVETATGLLGTGTAFAVGFVMNARRVRGLLDLETPLDESVFDHNVCVIVDNSCFEEGVPAEASSLAGTQELGNIVVTWDGNHIPIEGDTSITFNEDVLARCGAYGWHVQHVDRFSEDGFYEKNIVALNDALDAARTETKKPLLITLRTITGQPTPGRQNTDGTHGSKPGSEALKGLKKALDTDPEKVFDTDTAIVDEVRARVAARAAEYRKDWGARFEAQKATHPEQAVPLKRFLAGRPPGDWEAVLPTFEENKAIAIHAASGQVLNAIAPVLPELWGGSADLAGSNSTFLRGEPSFPPVHCSSSSLSDDGFDRSLHFGVCESAMGAVLNGITADGFIRAYGSIFSVFSDFMRGAVRLAVLIGLPVTYVWTHGSIGTGEDGLTYRSIEHLVSYRAIPNFAVVCLADAAETATSWKAILEQSHPTVIILLRQNLFNPARGKSTGLVTTEDLACGAYVLADTEGMPDVILLASGSEVSVALDARETLAADGITARVASVSYLDWFEAQGRRYRDSTLPPSARTCVSVEASIVLLQYRWIGDTGHAVFIEHFSTSAPGELLFKEYSIDAEHVAVAAEESTDIARS